MRFCVCFITGTAAISVGFRTLESPLLPFLILVDCEEKIKYLTQGDRTMSILDNDMLRYQTNNHFPPSPFFQQHLIKLNLNIFTFSQSSFTKSGHRFIFITEMNKPDLTVAKKGSQSENMRLKREPMLLWDTADSGIILHYDLQSNAISV